MRHLLNLESLFNACQACRQGGGGLIDFFWPPKYFIHRLATQVPILSVLRFVITSFTVTEKHRCPNEFGNSYALRLFMEDQRMNAERARKRMGPRKCVRT